MPTLKDLHNCKCPKCGCIDNFSFHCTYDRNLSFVLNSEVVNYVVTVTRVICNSCSSTHAILPDFIVPYKIMSFCSICNIVKDAVSSSVFWLVFYCLYNCRSDGCPGWLAGEENRDGR